MRGKSCLSLGFGVIRVRHDPTLSGYITIYVVSPYHDKIGNNICKSPRDESGPRSILALQEPEIRISTLAGIEPLGSRVGVVIL